MTPTLQDLKTLTQRKELLYLLRECETLPDSTLTARLPAVDHPAGKETDQPVRR